MPGLNEALGAGLLAPLVAVKSEALDTLHLVLPLLTDHLQEAFRADVLLLVVIVIVLSACLVTALRSSIIWLL